jgi:carboxylesterase
MRIGYEAKKGKTGVLLLHGLTGTPDEVRPLGEFLARHGYSVLIPWLAGHGTSPADLSRTRWQDWDKSALRSLDKLKERCTRVTVGGLSMGACLALHLASHEDVQGVLSMAGLYRLFDWRFNLIGFFKFLQWRTRELEGGIADPTGPAHPTYAYAPTQSLHELKKLMDHLRDDLLYVRVPALLVHGAKDSMVPPENADLLYAAIGSTRKTKVILPDSDHVIPLDLNKERLFRETLRFLKTWSR